MESNQTKNEIQINRLIDHTLLKPETTRDQILKLCEEARTYHFLTLGGTKNFYLIFQLNFFSFFCRFENFLSQNLITEMCSVQPTTFSFAEKLRITTLMIALM